MKILYTLMICTFALQMAMGQLEEAPPAEAPTEVIDTTVEVFRHTGEQMPEFPGGTKALLAFMDSTIRYPIELRNSCIEGKVIVQFVIWEDGCHDSFKVVRGIHPLLDAEAIRVIKLFPKWIPGRQRGKPVPVWFILPVKFSLR